MQELFAKMVGDNDARCSVLEAPVADTGALTEADLESLLRELRVAITARLSDDARVTGAPAPVRVATAVRETDTRMDFHLDGDAVHRPRYFRLSNRGTSSLQVHAVTCNGDGLMNTADIREWVQDGDPTSIRELAFALYLFCRRHQVHGPPPVADWKDPGILDPARFHAAFGYGLCGHSAHAFMGLCRLFGLRARIRGVRGHTFPEVHDEDGWHVVDPNGETWYPDPRSPASLLSLRDLAGMPGSYWSTVHFRPLGRGKTRESLFELLRNRAGHRTVMEVEGGGVAPAETPLLSLQPGESLTLYYDIACPWAAPREDASWLAPFVPPRNVRLMSIGRTVRSAEFQVESAGTIASFEYPTVPGWAAHDLSIDASPTRPDAFVDAPPKVWLLTRKRRLGPFAPLASGSWRLRRGFAALDDDESDVTLRVEFARDTCAKLDLETSYQYSVHAFPMPRPGDNTLRVRAGSSDEMPEAHAELGLAEPEPGDAGGRPIIHAPRGDVRLEHGMGLEFSWSADAQWLVEPPSRRSVDMPHVIDPVDRNRAARVDGHEFLVTRSTRRFDLAGPSLHRFVNSPGTVISADVVRAQLGTGSFHWRVRRVDADRRPIGQWSSPAAFRVTFVSSSPGTSP